MSLADLARIAQLEAAALTGPYPVALAPRGECSSCDAYRGVMWPELIVDGKRRPLALCDVCRAHWSKMRELEDLVRGWGEHQQAVADSGGWTPDMLREHHRALHPKR